MQRPGELQVDRAGVFGGLLRVELSLGRHGRVRAVLTVLRISKLRRFSDFLLPQCGMLGVRAFLIIQLGVSRLTIGLRHHRDV